MATKEQCNQYAAELTRRFDELVRWAMENWPAPAVPLLSSDFSESRREIANIVGSRLGEAEEADRLTGENRESAPYIDMNPMPWP